MHIAVCDDNVADRKQMERLLQRSSDRHASTTGVFYIDSYGNKNAIMRSPMLYDVFFIDMTDGPVNGFQLARELIDAGVTAPIVLCISSIDYRAIIETACADKPEDVVENSNHDILRRQLRNQILFLDKPILVARLEDMLNYALEVKANTVQTIELRGDHETLYVHEDEIMYVQKDGNFAHVVLTEDRQMDLLSTMGNFYSQLSPFMHFFPISEQVFVNVMFIKKVSLLKLSMTDGKHFTMSPLQISLIKKAVALYQQ